MQAAFFYFAYKMRRNTSSRLHFLSLTYGVYAPVEKAARFLSCLHFATARVGRNTSSRLRFLSLTYGMYAPVEKYVDKRSLFHLKIK